MKRYLIFAYSYYYPSGGWGDIRGEADTIEEADRIARQYVEQGGGSEVIDTSLGIDGDSVIDYDWDYNTGLRRREGNGAWERIETDK